MNVYNNNESSPGIWRLWKDYLTLMHENWENIKIYTKHIFSQLFPGGKKFKKRFRKLFCSVMKKMTIFNKIEN